MTTLLCIYKTGKTTIASWLQVGVATLKSYNTAVPYNLHIPSILVITHNDFDTA